MNRVSVVVPAFNAGRFLREALESALDQSLAPSEVVVVDDGSTDDTASVLEQFHGRIVRLRQSNAGQASARNRGVGSATGNLLAFLDADDIWSREKLERQVALFEGRPEVGLVYCSMRELRTDGSPGGRRQATLRGRCVQGVLLGQDGGAISGSTPVVRRELFEQLGGFAEDLVPCEDTDLFWRAALRTELDFVDAPLVAYRLHGTNAHLDLARMNGAWTKLYARAFADPEIRRLGASFRWRCRGRLHAMLSGDSLRAGRLWAAVVHGLRASAWWPPLAPRLLGRAIAVVGRRG